MCSEFSEAARRRAARLDAAPCRGPTPPVRLSVNPPPGQPAGRALFLSSGWLYALAGLGAARGGTPGLQLSDDVLVLSGSRPTACLTLLNAGRSPLELATRLLPPGGGPAGLRPLLCAPPARLALPPRGRLRLPLRALFPAALPAGEWCFTLRLRARTLTGGPASARDDPLPALPVSIYVRHAVGPPGVHAGPLQLCFGDRRGVARVRLSKTGPDSAARGFVGEVQLIDKASGRRFSGGRVHMPPGCGEAELWLPRGPLSPRPGRGVCLRLWDHYPAHGAPRLERCSGCQRLLGPGRATERARSAASPEVAPIGNARFALSEKKAINN